MERQGLWAGRGGGGGGGSVQGSPPRGAACLGRCLPHPSFRGRLFWKATTSGDSGSLVLFFCRLVVILLHSQLLWASRFSQKSPCKSHQIAAGDVWWHGSEVNLSFIKRKRRFYIHLVCVSKSTICIQMHKYIYIHTPTDTYIHICVYMYTRIYTHTHIYVCRENVERIVFQ